MTPMTHQQVDGARHPLGLVLVALQHVPVIIHQAVVQTQPLALHANQSIQRHLDVHRQA